MLDTTICIYVLKNRSTKLRNKFKAVKYFCISLIAYGEPCFGIKNCHQHIQKKRWEQLGLFAKHLTIENWGKSAVRKNA